MYVFFRLCHPPWWHFLYHIEIAPPGPPNWGSIGGDRLPNHRARLNRIDDDSEDNVSRAPTPGREAPRGWAHRAKLQFSTFVEPQNQGPAPFRARAGNLVAVYDLRG